MFFLFDSQTIPLRRYAQEGVGRVLQTPCQQEEMPSRAFFPRAKGQERYFQPVANEWEKA